MSPSALPRATKIVATIGTDSGTPEALRALLEAGVNVFRLNFSHGTQGEQAERIRAIRSLEEEAYANQDDPEIGTLLLKVHCRS